MIPGNTFKGLTEASSFTNCLTGDKTAANRHRYTLQFFYHCFSSTVNLNQNINADIYQQLLGNYQDNLAFLRKKLNGISHLSFIGNSGDKPVND